MEKSGDNKIFCFLGGREREEGQDERQTDRQSQQDIERNVIDNENTSTHLCHSKVYQKAPGCSFRYRAKYQKSLLYCMLFKKSCFHVCNHICEHIMGDRVTSV